MSSARIASLEARPRGAAFLALGLLSLTWGCDPLSWSHATFPAAETAGNEEPTTRTPAHVDSIFPMDEELRRFRVGLKEVVRLSGGARSRDELVELLIDRLEQSDTTAIAAMALTRAEFAWLYFPNTMYMSQPYELPPGFVWYHQQNRSSRGLTRLLRRFSGENLYYSGFRCPDEGEPFGAGRIWHGCTVLGELPTGEVVEERIFGSILELGGTYKLVSFSNEF